MEFALICLLALILLGMVAALLRGRRDDAPVAAAAGDCTGCDGTPSARCEQECMMEAATQPIEYFDDEELDEFSGRPSDQYTDDEAEQFRDVMLTMRPEEVPAWGRSLRLRGINLPNQVKDDFALFF